MQHTTTAAFNALRTARQPVVNFAGFTFPKMEWALPTGSTKERLKSRETWNFAGYVLCPTPIVDRETKQEGFFGYLGKGELCKSVNRFEFDATDIYQYDDVDDGVIPVIWKLPHGLFLAGVTAGDGMFTEFSREIFADSHYAWIDAREQCQRYVIRAQEAREAEEAEGEELAKKAEEDSIRAILGEDVNRLVDYWNIEKTHAQALIEDYDPEYFAECVGDFWRVENGKLITLVKDSPYMERCAYVEKSEDLLPGMPAQIPFPGFYNSLLGELPQQEIESRNENARDTGQGEIVEDGDYEFLAFAKGLAGEWVRYFLRDLGASREIWEAAEKSTSLDMPREYNYRTDRVFCNVPTQFVYDVLAKTDKDGLCGVAKSHCTSRSGFVSFYDPDFYTWGNIKNWDHNNVHLLFTAYMLQELGEDLTAVEIGYIDKGLMEWTANNLVVGARHGR